MTTPPTNPPGDDIRMAQVNAGEQAVIEKLRRQGLLPPNPPGETPNAKLLLALREAGSTGLDLSPGEPLCAKAAEAIAQLERDLAAMTQERDDNAKAFVDCAQKLAAAHAEVGRLTKALDVQVQAKREYLDRIDELSDAIGMPTPRSYKGTLEYARTLRARLTAAEQDADALAGALERAIPYTRYMGEPREPLTNDCNAALAAHRARKEGKA